MEGWDVVRALDVDVSVYRGISNYDDVIVVSVFSLGVGRIFTGLLFSAVL
jgi:hypothetical protein